MMQLDLFTISTLLIYSFHVILEINSIKKYEKLLYLSKLSH
jgi:hypothetical protein